MGRDPESLICPARLVLALEALNASQARTLNQVAVRQHHPIRRERADAGVRTVRGDEQRVEPESLWDACLVAGQVSVKGRARGHAGLLHLDNYQAEAQPERAGRE